MDINLLLKNYKKSKITTGVLGSHSALDICRGAKDLSLKTLVVVEKGRDNTYAKYYKSSPSTSTSAMSSAPNGSGRSTLGCVDEVFYVDKFKDLLNDDIQKKLIEKNVIFIPHRSFEVYINDYSAIENKFKVPMFGNRFLLKIEERGRGGVDQYQLMDKAGIRYPKQFKDPKDIDRLVIVKVLEKERGFERAFFLAKNYKEYVEKSEKRVGDGEFTKNQLKDAVIEEFLPGVQVNFNFFYDPLNNRLELIGTDTRRQTNHEGISKLSPEYQNMYRDEGGGIKYEEVGHIAVTVLESMLEQAFEIGEKFVKASKEMFPPGVIGSFGLQTMIIPGPPKKEIIVFDISPRMPGSPGVFATPYSGYLYGENISMGKRVAMEVKEAIEKNSLNEILT